MPTPARREKIDLAKSPLGLYRDGRAEPLPETSGPPKRIDGYSVGAPFMTREPPHDGEMHPDGDELLFVVSGHVTVRLDDTDPATRVPLAAGEAFVVPRGVWHKVLLDEPSQLIHVTPGPGGEWRPLGE